MADAESRYRRSFEELEQRASKFWPAELSRLEADLSIIPLFLETQDQFIAILSVDTPDLERLFAVIESSRLPANLFMKHLVILTDFGGELLQQVNQDFDQLFPDGKLHYQWHGNAHAYKFRAIPHQKFSNQNLHISREKLVEPVGLDELKQDAIALLLTVRSSVTSRQKSASLPEPEKVGDYVGNPGALSRLIKQRYIWLTYLITAGNVSSAATKE